MTRPRPNSDRIFLTNDFVTKYIFDRISELELDLSKFEIQFDNDVDYVTRSVRISVYLTNLLTNIKGCQVFFVSLDDMSKDAYAACADLDKLIDNVAKTPIDYYNKKENENMNTSVIDNYNAYRFTREKTQEEIELDEKINKIRAEADKKIAKLKAEFKEQTEKKKRDAKSKEIHDKYQSLIDTGFNADQAYDILKTKLGEFDL